MGVARLRARGRGHIGVRRARRGAAALAMAAALSLAAGGAPAVGAAGSTPFGAFAGYLWFGKQVHSISGAWTVPTLLGDHSAGIAATWIGAQQPGSRSPLIQIGVNELCGAPGSNTPGACADNVSPPDRYLAFWSDTARHFHPIELFGVDPGDKISARIGLSGGLWHLTITDATIDLSHSFTTRQEAAINLPVAVWTQEDVTNEHTMLPFPYPTLSTVHFTGVRVNGAAPAYAGIYSTWMSIPRELLAPTPLRADGFSVIPASVSAAGARYLRLAATVNQGLRGVCQLLPTLTAQTSHALVASTTAGCGAAIGAFSKGVSASRWPAPARAPLRSLARTTRSLARGVVAAARLPPNRLAAFANHWIQDEKSLSDAGHRARRALALPEYVN